MPVDEHDLSPLWVDPESPSMVLVGRIYDLATPVHLTSYQAKTFEEFQALAPDRAHVWLVEEALARLMARLESLNLVTKMLSFESFPLETPTLPINRHEWFNICLDVMLTRFSSVRDCALVVTARVLEMGLPDRDISLASVLRRHPPEEIASIIKDVEKCGADLRRERNRRIHHGAEVRYADDAHSMFKQAAWAEATWGPEHIQEEWQYEPPRTGTFKLAEEHLRIADRWLERHLKAAHEVCRLVGLLCEELEPEFEDRFGPKLRVSGLDASGRPKPEQRE